MRILIFLFLLFLTINGTILHDININEEHARLKRSNFPCGKSFVPCNTGIFATAGVETNNIGRYKYIITSSYSNCRFCRH